MATLALDWIGLGLAGLSKYSAALTAGGLAAFVALSPKQRRWLRHPAPYVSAIVAFAMVTPVIVWNARHGWASFEFQGARGAPNGELHLVQSPHDDLRPSRVFVAMDLRAPRRGHDERLPSTVGRAAPVPPLPQRADHRCLHPDAAVGRPRPTSLDDARLVLRLRIDGRMGRPARRLYGALRRWAFVSSALLLAIAGVAGLQSSTGWPWSILTARTGVVDPMLEGFEWRDLRNAPIFEQAPGFVIAMKWSDAGKIALALGPRVPVFVLSNDPRGWAY